MFLDFLLPLEKRIKKAFDRKDFETLKMIFKSGKGLYTKIDCAPVLAKAISNVKYYQNSKSLMSNYIEIAELLILMGADIGVTNDYYSQNILINAVR